VSEGAHARKGAGVAASKKGIVLVAKRALHAGDVRRYCKLMLDAGEYDLAVAAASALSHAFWVEMTERRACAPSDDTAKTHLLIGLVNEVIYVLIESWDADGAHLVATASAAGAFKMTVREAEETAPPVARAHIKTEFESPELQLPKCGKREPARPKL